MASQILLGLINKESDVDSLEQWLKDFSAVPQQYNLLEPGEHVTQGEFTIFMINYLHSEAVSGPRKCCTQPNKFNIRNIVPIPEPLAEAAGQSQPSPHSSNHGDNFPQRGVIKNRSKTKKYSIGESSVEDIDVDLSKLQVESPSRPLEAGEQSELSPYSPKYGDNFPKLGSSCRNWPAHKTKKYLTGDAQLEEIDNDLNNSQLEEINSRKINGKRGKRRIKPTSLNSSAQSGDNQFVGRMKQLELNIPVFTDAVMVESSLDLGDEREILKNERQKKVFFDRKENVSSYTTIPTTIPPVEIVQKELTQLMATIYSLLLRYSLVPNIMEELKFIIEMLITEPCSCGKKEIVNSLVNAPSDIIPELFTNIEQCVYFSTEVMRIAFELFWNLDTFTITLLSSNARIPSFNKELSIMISKYNALRIESVSNSTMPISLTYCKTIAFEYETDKRQNFISEKSFRLFCKQRDLFYEIYQSNNCTNGVTSWDSTVFNKNVTHLINMSNDPVNLSHLASLFVDQCINSVMYTKPVQQEQMEPYFPDLDYNKWLQLNKRLVQPLSEPANKEEELFFKDFIFAALNNRSFITVLSQTILKKISALTSEIISFFDIGDVQSVELRSKLFMTHHTLLLLGRFLGVSLYGHNLYSPQIFIQEKLLDIWSLTSPLVDFSNVIEKAVAKGTLILTIPWIIECFMFADPVSLNIPHSKALLHTIVSLFLATRLDRKIKNYDVRSRITEFDFSVKPVEFVLSKVVSNVFNEVEMTHTKFHNVQLTESTLMLLRLWISKLFSDNTQLLSLTEENFYSLLPTDDTLIEDIYLEDKNLTFDNANVITQHMLNKCFPFINQVLQSVKLNAAKSTVSSIRHITPVKINHPLPSKHNETVNLQIKLEESFFSVHKGLKSTLDFIVERITNVCKNTISTDIIEVEKKKLMENLKSVKDHYHKDNLKPILTEIVSTSINNIKTNTDATITDHCTARIPAAVNSLLSSDNGASFLSTCEKIATRKFKHQILVWVDLNIPVEETIITELMDEVDRRTRPYFEFQFSQSVDCLFHDSVAWSAKLIKLQEILERVMLKKIPAPTSDDMEKALYDVCDTVAISNLSAKVLGEIYVITWDLIITLITNSPKIVTDGLLDYITSFWKRSHYGDVEKRVLCVRNVHMAAKSDAVVFIPQFYAKLIALLVNKELLKLSDLEHQALSLLRHTWQELELHIITDIIYFSKDLLKDSPFYDDMKFSLMFEWLEETTAEIVQDYE